MKLAFCLFKYFPYGGLQRDFVRIARACIERGHTVEAFCLAWQGPVSLLASGEGAFLFSLYQPWSVSRLLSFPEADSQQRKL